MIDRSLALQLANKIGVSPEAVIMEAYQMALLNELSETPLSKHLIFKGGTCLRLAYQSFRFSEDLDFSLIKPVKYSDFQRQIKAIVRRFPALSIGETFNMKQTLFAKIIVKVGNWQIGIKIEISKRTVSWKKDRDYTYKLLESPASTLNPYFKVATLKRIYQDKLIAVKSRQKPRDWFDLWFLSQKLNLPWSSKINLSRKLMEDRVRFLLPKSKRQILKQFEHED